MDEALEALNSTEYVEVTIDDYILFTPKNQTPVEGIIFYPGGKVEPESYAPLLMKIAEYGFLVALVPMPFNLAFFSPNKAEIVIEKPELERLFGQKKQLRKIGNTYDVFIAEAPLMPLVGKTFGPVLGPRGKLPVPVPPNANISEIIKKHRKTVSIRMRNQPIIQCQVGTEDMPDEKIVDNIQAVLRVLERKLKRGLKNIKFLFIKTSMGTPIKIKP